MEHNPILMVFMAGVCMIFLYDKLARIGNLLAEIVAILKEYKRRLDPADKTVGRAYQESHENR